MIVGYSGGQGRRLVGGFAQAAGEWVDKRDRWLNPEGVTEKELKRRTLTNLYNARPTWLDLAHCKLNGEHQVRVGEQDQGDDPPDRRSSARWDA